MRNKILLIITILMMLSGCTLIKKDVAPIIDSVENKISKLTDKFEYVTGKCLFDDVGVEFITLNKDEEIDIVDKNEKFYFFNKDNLLLAVDRVFVRTEDDEPFEEYTVYSKKQAIIYSDYKLTKEKVTLTLDNEITVIDEILDVLYVDFEGIKGYMRKDDVSLQKTPAYTAPKVEAPIEETPADDGGGSSSGGGGGGYTPSHNQTPETGDGGNIELAFHQQIYIDKPLLTIGTTKGKIYVDETIAYISVLKRGDIVCISGEDKNNYEVLIDGRVGKVNKFNIRLDSEPQYEEWVGYAKNSTVYYDYELTKEIKDLKTNEEIKVVDKIGDICVVELEDGTIGYMLEEKISEEKIEVYSPTPRNVEQPVENVDNGSSDGGGSSSGGGNHGGGSHNPSAPSGDYGGDHL